jgi:DNA repair protein RecO (recombination protein O)
VVSVLAKGTRREKSQFGGALDLLYLGQALIIFRPRSSLNILSAYQVETAFPRLRDDLPRVYAACHLVELVIGMTREEEPLPELFDLLTRGLALIEDADGRSLPALTASLELWLLAELGFAPALDCCASCAGETGGGPISLSPPEGGALCRNCRDRDPTRMTVQPGTFQTLRHLAGTSPERSIRMKLSREDERRIREFLTAFEEWRLERRLRTAKFV